MIPSLTTTTLRLGALLLACLAVAPTAHAARSSDSCTGYITSLPATINAQGVWCLGQHLSTAQDSGAAITIATNNVTIDCNDFKIGGLLAGPGSNAAGILAVGQQNATVRHCHLRGFHTGIRLTDGGGHLVEGNRLDQNLVTGILVLGHHNRIQDNSVTGTGGHTDASGAYGIRADAEVRDNLVSGVFLAGPTQAEAIGIKLFGDDHEVRGNTVRGLATDSGEVFAISADGDRTSFVGNNLTSANKGWGIYARGQYTVCLRNASRRFTRNYQGCSMQAGNLAY